jgi:transposase
MTRARLGRVFPLAAAIRLYGEGKTMREVAKILGYTKSPVRAYLAASGIPLRSRGGARAMKGIPHPNYSRKAR